MVKFRCPVCTQKILVNDEGIGLVIPCPNCERAIAIPSATDPEFQGQALLIRPVPMDPRGLRPQLARLLMDRLFQAVFQQRRQLLAAQQLGTAQVALLENRLAAVARDHRAQLQAYERRIADLERQLAQRDDQHRQFIREKLRRAQEALDRQDQRLAETTAAGAEA